MASHNTNSLGNHKAIRLYTDPYCLTKGSNSTHFSSEFLHDVKRKDFSHLCSGSLQQVNNNDSIHCASGPLQDVNHKNSIHCSSRSIPSESSSRSSSPLQPTSPNTFSTPSTLCGASTSVLGSPKLLLLWTKLINSYSPPAEASENDFHRNRQATINTSPADDPPPTDCDEFKVLWQRVMAVASPSTSRLPSSEHLSFDRIYKRLNVVAMPAYSSFNSWSNPHGDVEEKIQKATGEAGPRLYCQIGNEFTQDLTNLVTQYMMQERTYQDFQDLLRITLFLPGNSDPTGGRTRQAEIRSRVHVTSKNLARHHDLSKGFLLPPVVNATAPPSHKSLSAADSNPARNSDTLSIMKAPRPLEVRPRHPKAQTSEVGSLPPSKASYPSSAASARLHQDETYTRLTFPEGNYDLSYWINTKHEVFHQEGISHQTFVLPSHHTSPYLTIVCPDFRPIEEKEIQDCARSLYFKLVVKGGAALFTRYMLRELAVTTTRILAKPVQPTNAVKKEVFEMPPINMEGIEHFGITMNAMGGFRAYRLSPILAKNPRVGEISQYWAGMDVKELFNGELTELKAVSRLRDFINTVHCQAGVDGVYLRGLLSDLKACCLF